MANSVEQYKIPDEYSSQKDLILNQIKIIDELFPRQKQTNEPVAKRIKSDENVSEPSNAANSSSAVTASNGTSSSASTSQKKTSMPKVNIHDYIKVVNPKEKMAQKLAAARPYNYFLTCITSSPQTHSEPLSITFQEILDPSLGDLECSVQINFMVEAVWLLGQYYFAGYLECPMLILYGSGSQELETISKTKPQIKAHFVKMPTPFATHHTKMMLLGYKDGPMRVIVSTANLYEDDWHNRTQGLWMSEKLDAMPSGSDTEAGESKTELEMICLNIYHHTNCHSCSHGSYAFEKRIFHRYMFTTHRHIHAIHNEMEEAKTTRKDCISTCIQTDNYKWHSCTKCSDELYVLASCFNTIYNTKK